MYLAAFYGCIEKRSVLHVWRQQIKARLAARRKKHAGRGMTPGNVCCFQEIKTGRQEAIILTGCLTDFMNFMETDVLRMIKQLWRGLHIFMEFR